MPPRTRDPLLAAVRIMLALAVGILGVVATALLIGVPAIFVMRVSVMAHIATQGTPPDAIWAIMAVMALGAAACVLGIYFFRHLYRIVCSVGEGDAFAPVNAQRLSAMGWIVVGAHVLGIPLGIIVHWIQSVTENFHAEAAISPSSILLALILFILARVFREGTRMRDELEGTV
jgi:hypothetical protein